VIVNDAVLVVESVGFRTTWAVMVETVDGNTNQLTNRIEVEYRPSSWAIPSALVATPFWIRRHSEEETSRFADSVAVAAQHRQS
jgi:hypothetical protein